MITSTQAYNQICETRTPVHTAQAPGIGQLELYPLAIDADAQVIHHWVNQEYAKYWMMQGTTTEQVKEEYIRLLAHSDIYIGAVNRQYAFLLEKYKALDEEVGRHYEAQSGDYGMHILVGPADRPVSGFTWQVFRFIMQFLFMDDRVKRVVVEPDVNNEKIHVLNYKAGFEYQGTIRMPHKEASLAFCTRSQFQKALFEAH